MSEGKGRTTDHAKSPFPGSRSIRLGSQSGEWRVSRTSFYCTPESASFNETLKNCADENDMLSLRLPTNVSNV